MCTYAVSKSMSARVRTAGPPRSTWRDSKLSNETKVLDTAVQGCTSIQCSPGMGVPCMSFAACRKGQPQGSVSVRGDRTGPQLGRGFNFGCACQRSFSQSPTLRDVTTAAGPRFPRTSDVAGLPSDTSVSATRILRSRRAQVSGITRRFRGKDWFGMQEHTSPSSSRGAATRFVPSKALE